MHVMNQYLENVSRENEMIARSDEDWQRLRLAALLHDVGHHPFSHALESVIEEKFNGLGHEKQGVHIINNIISDNLGSYSPHEITDILTKKVSDNVYPQLISSDIDADKVDYLLRDAYHTGVTYGYIDVGRLLRVLRFDSEGDAIVTKAGPVIENLLIARLHMFRSVYYHKTINAFDAMIARIFQLLVERDFLPDPAQLLGSEDPAELASFDDHLIWTAMVECERSHNDDFLTSIVRMFLTREHLALACSEVHYSTREQGLPEGCAKVVALKNSNRMMDALVERASRISGTDISREWIFPFVSPKRISIIPEDTPLRIEKNGEKIRLEEEDSLFLPRLGSVILTDTKIYTKPGLEQFVKQAFEETEPQ